MAACVWVGRDWGHREQHDEQMVRALNPPTTVFWVGTFLHTTMAHGGLEVLQGLGRMISAVLSITPYDDWYKTP